MFIHISCCCYYDDVCDVDDDDGCLVVILLYYVNVSDEKCGKMQNDCITKMAF